LVGLVGGANPAPSGFPVIGRLTLGNRLARIQTCTHITPVSHLFLDTSRILRVFSGSWRASRESLLHMRTTSPNAATAVSRPFSQTRGAESWEDFLSVPTRAEEAEILSRHVRTGRPFGDADFVAHLERELGRSLVRAKPGRKPGGSGRI
jgi:hypothetical protein